MIPLQFANKLNDEEKPRAKKIVFDKCRIFRKEKFRMRQNMGAKRVIWYERILTPQLTWGFLEGLGLAGTILGTINHPIRMEKR